MARGGVVIPWPAAGAVCVGFSGGLDSTVLLHALHATARAEGRQLTAVHVHHGLSANADRWADQCRGICARLGVPLDVVRVNVPRDSPRGLEGEARAARYAVYAAREEPVVALAHHLDDQAETVLLQLLRGTGLKGIAAMPRLRALNERVALCRPLLAFSRAELEAHARANALHWIEDESNASRSHDRNYLRHEIAPLLDARFPAWRASVARFAAHAAGAQSLLDDLARIDGLPAEPCPSLAIDPTLDDGRRANLLRAFLASHDLAMPGETRMAEIARQLFDARPDAQVRIEHDGMLLTRYRGHLRVDSPHEGDWRVAWRGEPHIDLGAALGAVDFEASVGEGVRAERTRAGEWFFAPRKGGERLRMAAGRPSRTLKNLLQEHALAPVERSRLPLLFNGDDLVWVPGVGIAAEYACAPGQPGLKPLWRVAGKAPLC